MQQYNFTRFEIARIVGARALQISMGAPILLANMPAITDSLAIAFKEWENSTIPITPRRSPYVND